MQRLVAKTLFALEWVMDETLDKNLEKHQDKSPPPTDSIFSLPCRHQQCAFAKYDPSYSPFQVHYILNLLAIINS